MGRRKQEREEREAYERTIERLQQEKRKELEPKAERDNDGEDQR